jgi:plasmid stabilization system protein ParE
MTDIEAIVDRIGTTPQQFPTVEGGIRRAQLRRFPYSLFFRVDAKEIRIVACLHGSRDPRRWQERP